MLLSQNAGPVCPQTSRCACLSPMALTYAESPSAANFETSSHPEQHKLDKYSFFNGPYLPFVPFCFQFTITSGILTRLLYQLYKPKWANLWPRYTQEQPAAKKTQCQHKTAADWEGSHITSRHQQDIKWSSQSPGGQQIFRKHKKKNPHTREDVCILCPVHLEHAYQAFWSR